MATRDEYEALYRAGKELEAKEESTLPEMAGSTDFYSLLGKALVEAKNERGKVEILFDHPTQIRIQVYRVLNRASHHRSGASDYAKREDVYQFTREYTHYL